MKIYEIVFSATGRTKKVVDIISSVFTEEKEKINLCEVIGKDMIYNLSPIYLY